MNASLLTSAALGECLAGMLAIALLAAPLTALPQNKIPVYLTTTVAEDDNVGRQVVFELKEAIRGSQGYRLVDETTAWPYLRVVIVTLKTSPAYGTAISYTYLYDSESMPLRGAFITASVQTCGSAEVVRCARSALGYIDNASERLQQEKPEFRRTLLK